MFLDPVRSTPEKFENAIIIGHFGFAFEEKLVSEMYGSANDPRTANEPGPEMIPDGDLR